MKTIKIDIVSDVVCPWCYLGKARLETALGQLKDVKAEINWRPYQLDPSIPRGGVDRKQYMEAKFGTEARVSSEIHNRNWRPLGPPKSGSTTSSTPSRLPPTRSMPTG